MQNLFIGDLVPSLQRSTRGASYRVGVPCPQATSFASESRKSPRETLLSQFRVVRSAARRAEKHKHLYYPTW